MGTVLDLSLTPWVTLGKSLAQAEPQVSHLENGEGGNWVIPKFQGFQASPFQADDGGVLSGFVQDLVPVFIITTDYVSAESTGPEKLRSRRQGPPLNTSVKPASGTQDENKGDHDAVRGRGRAHGAAWGCPAAITANCCPSAASLTYPMETSDRSLPFLPGS